VLTICLKAFGGRRDVTMLMMRRRMMRLRGRRQRSIQDGDWGDESGTPLPLLRSVEVVVTLCYATAPAAIAARMTLVGMRIMQMLCGPIQT
jgi:hypothetical protein